MQKSHAPAPCLARVFGVRELSANKHRPQWTLPPSLLAQEIAPCRAFPSQQAACGRRLAVCDRRISRSRRKDGTWSERRR